MNKWTEQEIGLLRILWWDYTPKEVASMLPGRDYDAIHSKASKLKLKRSEETAKRILEDKKNLVRARNVTVLGKPMTYERVKATALKYTTRTEFYRKDHATYQYIRDNGLWDELCSHMAIGNFNYSEAFLHECLKDLFPDVTVIRNSRKIVPPYELDFYIPEYRVAFEYDGSAFHNKEDVKERDANKTQKCLEAGVLLFRMKERRETRRRPESSIVEALREFGFDTDVLNVEACTCRAFETGYSDYKIREIVAKYTTLKEFRKNETPLYTLLTNRGLLEKYLSGLYRHVADNDPESVSKALSDCKTASEFRDSHYGMYLAMRKNPEKYKEQFIIYSNLRHPDYKNGKRKANDLTYRGVTKTMDIWSKETGIPMRLINKRLAAKWPVERILTEPYRKRKTV